MSVPVVRTSGWRWTCGVKPREQEVGRRDRIPHIPGHPRGKGGEVGKGLELEWGFPPMFHCFLAYVLSDDRWVDP